MGDLSDLNQGHETGDEHFLSLISNLGDLDQLKVDDDLIKRLSDVWNEIKTALSQDQIRDRDRIVFRLLIYTSVAVVDAKYMNKIDPSLKTSLVSAVGGVEQFLEPDYPALYQLCSSLGPILTDPWQYPAFAQLGGSVGEITKQLIDLVWTNEGVIFLEGRLEALARPKKLQMPNIIAKIFHVLLSKGKSKYASAPPGEEDSSTVSPLPLFDPYHFTFTRYIEYLEVYVLLWSKTNEVFEGKFLTDLCPSVMATVINSLHAKLSQSCDVPVKPKLLMPKVWKGNKDAKDILIPLIDLILPPTLDRPCEPQGVKDLLSAWLKLFIETTEEAKQLAIFGDVVDNLLMKREKIHSSDYVYVLSEVILEKFGHNRLSLPIYVDTYLRAMMMDVNLIDKLRAETPENPVRVKEEHLRLSPRFIALANYLKDYKSIAKELILTAFSLNPTEELFNRVFPQDEQPSTSQSQIGADSSLTTIIPPTSGEALDPPQESTSTTKPDPQLPEDVVDVLKVITQTPRWGALGHFAKGEELKQLCRTQLKLGSDFLSKEKKLEYVDVDYTQFAHLPSKYDPNDDGIERGYIRPGERKKMIVKRNMNISWIRKGGIKKQPPKKIGSFKSSSSSFKYSPTSKSSNSKMIQDDDDDLNDLYELKIQGRHAKNLEVTGILERLRQYKNAIKNGPEAFGNSWNPTKKTMVKRHYEKKFLQPSLPFPGSYDWIPDPDPKPISFPISNTKGKNNKNKPVRKPPTVYIPRKTPLQNAGSQLRVEDELLRQCLPQSKITAAFIPGTRNAPRLLSMAKTLQDLIPETTEAEWNEVEVARGVQISSKKKLHSQSSSGFNFSPVVRLDRETLSVPKELEALTKEYLALRASTLKARMDKKLGPEEDENHSNGNPEDLLCQERQAMKKVLYSLAPDVQEPPPVKVRQAKGVCGRGRGRWGKRGSLGKENVDVAPILETTDQKESLPQDENSLEKQQLSPAAAPEMEEVEEVEEDVLQYELGLVWELDVASKQIIIPKGPRKAQDRCKRNLIISDALERIKKNLGCKSYTWRDVINNARDEVKELENIAKAEETRRAEALLSPTPSWSPIVGSSTGEHITKDQTVMALGRAKRKISLMSKVFQDSPALLVRNEFSLPASITSSIKKEFNGKNNSGTGQTGKGNKNSRQASIDSDDDDNFEPSDDDNDDSEGGEKSDEESEDASYSSRRATKSKSKLKSKKYSSNSSKIRKYRFYSDDVVENAIAAIKKGKTVKKAADMYNMNRSALCKRLEVMGFRKDGKYFIPANFREVINTFKKKIAKKGGHDSSKSDLRSSGGKRGYGEADLLKAIDLVMFEDKSYNEAFLATSVPYSTIAAYVNIISKREGEAKVALLESESKLAKKGHSGSTLPGEEEKIDIGGGGGAMDHQPAEPSTSTVYDAVTIPQNKANVLKALVLLGRKNSNLSFERAALKCGVPVKDVAVAVDTYCLKQLNGLNSKDGRKRRPRHPVPLSNRRRSGRTSYCEESMGSCKSSMSVLDGGENSDSQSESQAECPTPMLPGFDNEPTSSSPSTPLPIPDGGDADIVETDKPPEKKPYQVFFPMLRTISKCTGLVAAVTCKGPMKEVLDETTGQIIEVPDEGEVMSKEDEIIARLSPCPWRDEEEKAALQGDSQEETQAKENEESKNLLEFHEQTKALLTHHPEPVVLTDNSTVDSGETEFHSVPVPIPTISERNVIPNKKKRVPVCFVVLDPREANLYLLNRPTSDSTSTKSSTSNPSEPDVSLSLEQVLPPSGSGSTENLADSCSVKRSERIKVKPKVDFKSGTPKIVPNESSKDLDPAAATNATIPPATSSKKNPLVNGNKRKIEDSISHENGDVPVSIYNNKKRKVGEENLVTATAIVSTIPSVPGVNGSAKGKSNKKKPTTKSVARKRTTAPPQPSRKRKESISDEEDEDLSDHYESPDDNDRDPDYQPDFDNDTVITTRKSAGEIMNHQNFYQVPSSSCQSQFYHPQGQGPNFNLEQAEVFTQPLVGNVRSIINKKPTPPTKSLKVGNTSLSVVLLGNSSSSSSGSGSGKKPPPQRSQKQMPRPQCRKQDIRPKIDPLLRPIPPLRPITVENPRTPEIVTIISSDEEEDQEPVPNLSDTTIRKYTRYPTTKYNEVEADEEGDDYDDDNDQSNDAFAILPDDYAAREAEGENNGHVDVDVEDGSAELQQQQRQPPIVQMGGPIALGGNYDTNIEQEQMSLPQPPPTTGAPAVQIRSPGAFQSIEDELAEFDDEDQPDQVSSYPAECRLFSVNDFGRGTVATTSNVLENHSEQNGVPEVEKDIISSLADYPPNLDDDQPGAASDTTDISVISGFSGNSDTQPELGQDSGMGDLINPNTELLQNSFQDGATACQEEEEGRECDEIEEQDQGSQLLSSQEEDRLLSCTPPPTQKEDINSQEKTGEEESKLDSSTQFESSVHESQPDLSQPLPPGVAPLPVAVEETEERLLDSSGSGSADGDTFNFKELAEAGIDEEMAAIFQSSPRPNDLNDQDDFYNHEQIRSNSFFVGGSSSVQNHLDHDQSLNYFPSPAPDAMTTPTPSTKLARALSIDVVDPIEQELSNIFIGPDANNDRLSLPQPPPPKIISPKPPVLEPIKSRSLEEVKELLKILQDNDANDAPPPKLFKCQ